MTEPALPPFPEETDKVLRTFAIVTWLWFLIGLPFFTDVACGFFATVVLIPAWMMLFIVWLLLGTQGGLRSPASKRWWRIAGVAGALGLFLAITSTGLVARVALSRPWLDAYAAQVLPGTRDDLHEVRVVGLFLVDGTREAEGTVFLYTSTSWLNRHGVVRVPTGQAPPRGRFRPGHRLLGAWHTFWWKF